MIWTRGVVRYEGFVFEPNTFAMFQIYLVPLLMFCVAAFRRPLAARPFFIAAIVASIVVLVLSFSRGGFVALVATLLLLLFLERRNKPVLISGIAVIAAALAYSPGIYWERVATVLSPGTHVQDFSVFTRFETMRVALRLGLDHPWLGVGIENFIYQSAYYIPYKLVVHNSFLEIFSELGVFGLALFLSMVVYNATILLRLAKRRDDPEAVQIGKMLLIQQFAILVCSFFIPSAYEMIFWFTIALPAIADYAYRSEARGA
jgi:O-antigen ligase